MANANNSEFDMVSEYRKYTDEVKNQIRISERKIGRKMLSKVRETSPVRELTSSERKHGTKRDPGTYKKGWQLKTLKNSAERYIIAAVNKTDAPLSHLIDLGHKARVSSGKSYRGNKHITNAQKEANDELKREIDRILKEAGE